MSKAEQQAWVARLLRRERRPAWVVWASPAVSVALTLGLKLLLAPLQARESPFQLFLAAVVISAWIGGRAAGLIATLLAALVADSLFLMTSGRVLAGDLLAQIPLLLFIVEGAVISYFGGALDAGARHIAQQAEMAARQAAELVARQQAEADLQERLRIETVLRVSEARYRTLVEHLPNIAVFMFDHDLRYVLVDGSALGRHGYAKADLEGRTLWEVLPPERAAALAPAYQAALRGETNALSHERDGYTYRSCFVPVYDTDGRPIAGMAVVEDTTERTLAERALRANEQRFQAFMDHSPTLAWLTDTAGRVHFANATLRRSAAIRADHFEGMLIDDLFANTVAAEHLANIRQVAETGQALEVIEAAPRIDGGMGEYLVYKFPIDTDEGRLIGGVAVDITVQRQVEAQLRSSLQEKDVLLREIHHRVKNNLQLIMSLLRLQASTYTEPTLRKLLQESQERIRAIALIHEKLYQSTNLAQVNIASYIRSLTSYLTRSYSSGAIQVMTELDELSLSIDQAVPCGLILHELVSNAFKHAFPPGGTGQIVVALRRADSGIELCVADDGVGLQRGLAELIHVSLGLQLVSTFVEQLQGTLSLVPGRGTSVRIVFPYRQFHRIHNDTIAITTTTKDGI